MEGISRWKERMKFTFLNLPLWLKLISIVIFSMAVLAGTSVVGIRKLRRQYDQLLYNSYQVLLSSSAGELNKVLDNTTDYMKTIATNETIQEYLVSIKEGEYLSASTVRSMERELQRFINDEMNDALYGVSIYTDRGIFYNSSYKYDNGYDASLGTKFSKEEMERVVQAAPEEKTLWLTDYSDSYGLVVVQNIRRISPLRLDSLGVLVGCLNLQPVILACTEQIQQETCYFSLLDADGSTFYTYNNMGQEVDFSSDLESDGRYTVFRQNNRCYFVIRGSVNKNGWDYLYAIPYDSIENTMRKNAVNIILMLCFCIVLAVGAAMLMLRQILRDFAKLMQMIAKVSDVDFESVELDKEDRERTDEVGVLMQQFTRMSDKIDRLIQDNYESRLLAQEAKLQALEMQINPHFLYNTLESVRCCAKLGKCTDVCCIVESLGNIMHLIMSNHNNELRLQQELELIDDYILIQKIRFDNRLEFSKQVDAFCDDAVLPKLTILPLVENAIVHGVENCPDTCYIQLKVWEEEERVRIQIRNTGTQFVENFWWKLQNKEITPTRHGIGLLNVDSRLKLFYKKDYKIEFYNEEGLAVADVTIPYWTERNKE